MKRVKKFLWGLMAAGLVLSTAACGNKNTEEEADKYEYISKANTYMLESNDAKSSTIVVSVTKDTIKYLEVQYDDNYDTKGYILHSKDIASGSDTKTELKKSEEAEKRLNAYLNSAYEGKDGKLYLMSSSYDSETGEESTYFDVYASDGSFSFSSDLSSAMNSFGLGYISQTIVGDDGNYYISGDGGIGVVDEEGKALFKIDMDGWVDSMFKGADGAVYAAFYDYRGDSTQYVVKKVNTTSKALEETKISLESNSSRYWIPCNETKIFSYTDNRIEIVDLTTGEEEALWNWLDIDYLQIHLLSAWANEDGSYGFAAQNYSDDYIDQVEIATVTKELVTDENRREKVVFGVKSYLDDSTMKAIQSFNKTNGKYKIVINNYYEDYDYTEADSMLKADIAAGKIDFVTSDSLDLELVSKKSFVDLSSYMENDPNMNPEDFFTNIFEASKIDGKQYFVSPAFSIITLIGNAKVIGNNSTWTVDDMVKLREQYPESGFMSYATKSGMLSYFLYYSPTDFIDYSKGTCNFNSDSFKRLLEICNTFPEEINYDDYDDWALIAEGDVFLTMLYLSDLDSISIYKKIFSDDANIIGFPTDSGCGHNIVFNNYYSILANSKHKEGAWAFISTLFDDNHYNNTDYINGFPIKKRAFDAVMESKLNQSGGGAVGNGSTMIDIPQADKEAVNEVKSIIEKANNMVLINEKIYDIITEEVKPYFANSKTLDETCDTIQKRVSLYFAETK